MTRPGVGLVFLLTGCGFVHELGPLTVPMPPVLVPETFVRTCFDEDVGAAARRVTHCFDTERFCDQERATSVLRPGSDASDCYSAP